MRNPHQTFTADGGLSFRGRSKEFYKPGTMICIVHQVSAITPMISNPVILYSVPWPTCEQDYQCEYSGEHNEFNAHYIAPTNHSPPRLPITIIVNIIMPEMMCVFIMLQASYRSARPGADICPEPSSRDPLSSAPSSRISLSTCACYRI